MSRGPASRCAANGRDHRRELPRIAAPVTGRLRSPPYPRPSPPGPRPSRGFCAAGCQTRRCTPRSRAGLRRGLARLAGSPGAYLRWSTCVPRARWLVRQTCLRRIRAGHCRGPGMTGLPGRPGRWWRASQGHCGQARGPGLAGGDAVIRGGDGSLEPGLGVNQQRVAEGERVFRGGHDRGVHRFLDRGKERGRGFAEHLGRVFQPERLAQYRRGH
jgi:hypothetical protein